MRVPDSVVTHGAGKLTDSKEERGRKAVVLDLVVRRRLRSVPQGGKVRLVALHTLRAA